MGQWKTVEIRTKRKVREKERARKQREVER